MTSTSTSRRKPLDNGKIALRDGGIIILVSACRSGVGSQAFLDLLSSEKTCQAVVDKLDREYKLGYHKAGKMAEIGVRGSDVGGDAPGSRSHRQSPDAAV